jgi:hypothetical protein
VVREAYCTAGFQAFRCPLWVKSRKSHSEQMLSALSPKADIKRGVSHVGLVPTTKRVQQWMHQKADYSITSSAVARSDGGTVRPSIRAAGALMTSSNLLDCTTGNSAGFAPLSMRPA